MKVIQYSLNLKQAWDNFIHQAKNSHFMFYRDYMDYHSDRFSDASLMIYDQSQLVAVFPANRCDGVIHSHQGLSFGGLIMADKLRSAAVIQIFEAIIQFYRSQLVTKIIYKSIPHIYHSYPAEEDLYALTRFNTKLIRCDISSTIQMKNKIEFVELRKRAVRKALKNKLRVEQSYDFKAYWQIVSTILEERYNSSPTHTVEEIELLADRFPNNIKLFVAYTEANVLLAGVVVYINNNVVHTQYLANSSIGKECGALDYIISHLLGLYANIEFFDFGISTENCGKILNEGLIFQKEGFGGRGIVHNFYEINIA
jgi:hypothetical protein